MTLAADGGLTAKAQRWPWRSKARADARLTNAADATSAHAGTRWATFLGCTLYSVIGAPAIAGDLAYGGGYVLTRESNPTRVSVGAAKDSNQAFFVGVAYEEQTDDVSARLLAQAEKRVYQINSQLDDTNYYVDAVGVWSVIPQFFRWTFEDNLRDARLDNTRPDSPTNRTQVNSLSTGPDLDFRLGATDTLRIGGRYGRFDNSSTSNTTDFVSGFARLLHRTSERSTFSLNYEMLHAEFEGTGFLYPSTDRLDLFARFEWRALPNTLTLDAGISSVTPSGGETRDGPLFQLTTARQLSPESSLRFQLISNYSDTYSDMIRSLATTAPLGDVVSPPRPDVLTSDVYYNERVELLYASDNGSFAYGLRGGARRVDYETLIQDFEEAGARIDLLWRYSGSMQLYGMGRYSKRKLLQINETDMEWEALFGLRFNINQEFSAWVEVGDYTFESTGPLGNISNARIMLLLGYSSGRLYTPRSRR